MDRAGIPSSFRSRVAAAERGEAEALYELGLMYSTGQGVPFDSVIAHKWLNLAAMRGLRRAAVDRRDLARDMTPEEVARAQKLAREWIATHDVGGRRVKSIQAQAGPGKSAHH